MQLVKQLGDHMGAPEKESVQKSPVSVNINSPENCIIVADHIEINLFCGSPTKSAPAPSESAETSAPARK